MHIIVWVKCTNIIIYNDCTCLVVYSCLDIGGCSVKQPICPCPITTLMSMSWIQLIHSKGTSPWFRTQLPTFHCVCHSIPYTISGNLNIFTLIVVYDGDIVKRDQLLGLKLQKCPPSSLISFLIKVNVSFSDISLLAYNIFGLVELQLWFCWKMIMILCSNLVCFLVTSMQAWHTK